jgi:hypothetical protein
MGDTGPEGDSGVLAFGHFYAIMPPDNAATVAPGAAVDFPQDGPVEGIIRASSSEFILPQAGIYEVYWQVSVTEAGQLVLGLDSGLGVIDELAATVAGRATGTSQFTNNVLIETVWPDSILTVRNPMGNSTALTITPIAGGPQAVAASLVIKQIR